MQGLRKTRSIVRGFIAVGVCLWVMGCRTATVDQPFAADPLPRELEKVSLPEYVVEPPDILVIDALNVVPLDPYVLGPLDVLGIQVSGTPQATEEQRKEYPPISGNYQVQPDGMISLGLPYGSVRVLGMKTDEAKAAIETHLKQKIAQPVVEVVLIQPRAMQQIMGEHLVRPDGSVSLGTFGSVYVAGLTLEQTREAVSQHLLQFVQKPDISVDVFSYNSKVYYIVSDGGGSGQQITRLPITGNETVLDAIAQVGGLSTVSSKHITVVRPTPAHHDCPQVLRVDWGDIVKRGVTTTNYQIMPGDRIYVKADPLISVDTFIAKVTSPVERILGSILLFDITVKRLEGGSQTGAGGGF